MKIIKGLMIKDLLQLKNYKRSLILFICIFFVSSIIQEPSRNVLTIMMTLGFSMFGVASLSYDEMAKADKYILTLPLTRKHIIESKYIFVIVSTIIGAVIGMIATMVILEILQKDLLNIQELMKIGMISIFVMAILNGIQIPCIYKYGAEKGRMQIMITMVILGAIVGGFGMLEKTFNMNFLTDEVMNVWVSYFPIILLLGTMIIYLVSYQISYRIYLKKEM